jgi:hypothetical protein
MEVEDVKPFFDFAAERIWDFKVAGYVNTQEDVQQLLQTAFIIYFRTSPRDGHQIAKTYGFVKENV